MKALLSRWLHRSNPDELMLFIWLWCWPALALLQLVSWIASGLARH